MDIVIKIPDIGIDQAEVIDILVHVNDIVEKEQSVIVIEGEKASMEIPSTHCGKVKEIKVKVTDIVRQDCVIMILEPVEDVLIPLDHVKENIKIIENRVFIIHASPLIRRLARSLNINLKKIIGSGRKNRIMKHDLDNYLINVNSHTNNRILSIKNQEHTCNFDFSRFGEVEEVKCSKIKKLSGDLLSKNWSKIPHVTQFDEVDITDLEAFRIKYNNKIQNKSKKFTLLTFIVKAITKGLEKFPYLNSTISNNGEIIFLKKYINIGIAVNTSNGLLVPVIKNVQNKSLSHIAYEIYQKSNSARLGKIKISDLQGGCFTISSLGGIGGTAFSPIINASEAAILGVSKFCYKPIWNGTAFIPKLILPLSLSYDHRIIDGVEGAKFISYINELLVDIRLLLV
ncbi:Dihydrolipoyllysine-residue acetyltransferase component of pyruvate dehydrogenase complex [Buchnera aphidicola (Takecallis arundicolens)]|uniref:2-oxo acid dehydrogenase subunit E2 n=1 Tax=Buchnera aphidicola TaxID=9 RepID=UPI003464412C